jgi:predicted dehydrogenase
VNILIIGLGSIAGKHIQAIHNLVPQANLYALRSSVNTTLVEGVTNIYRLDELKVKPDFVIISNPTNLHALAITQCIEMGVPLFIEKPLFDTLDNKEALVKQVLNARLLTYIACNLRFHPAIRFLKVQLHGKRINEVNVYCGSYLPDWRPGRDFRTIYSANAHMGGGVHLDLIHEIDYCFWIFGQPQHTHAIRRNASHLDISATDYAHYSLTYEKFVANITLNYFRKDTKRTVEVLSDDSTWVLDLSKCEITDHKGNIIFKQDYKILDTYTDQMRYFLNHLKEKKEPMNGIAEAFNVLQICLTHE